MPAITTNNAVNNFAPTGAGAPSGTQPAGTLYWDTSNSNLYVSQGGGNWQLVGGTSGSGGWTKLQTIDAGGIATLTFNFTGGGYKLYKVIAVASIPTINNTTTLYMRMNGDTGTNYEYQTLYASGATITAANNTSQSVINLSPIGNSASREWSNLDIQISDPASTQSKGFISHSGGNPLYSVGSDVRVISGEWSQSSSYLTSITLYTASAATMSTGSTFILYGLS